MLLAAESVQFSTPANIAFGLLAALMIYAAVRVVTTKNVVHAALWLVIVLAGMGANYLLLQAEFVAVTQFMVYIGAIVVLFLFGTMLTRGELGKADDLDNPKMRWVGVAVAALVMVVIGGSIIATYGDDRMTFAGASESVGATSAASVADVEAGAGTNTTVLSDQIFGEYLLPFELVSVLLLGALIGAIVLARKE